MVILGWGLDFIPACSGRCRSASPMGKLSEKAGGAVGRPQTTPHTKGRRLFGQRGRNARKKCRCEWILEILPKAKSLQILRGGGPYG